MKLVFSSFTPGNKIAWLFLFLLAGVITAAALTEIILTIPGMGGRDGATAIYTAAIIQSVLATALPAYAIVALTHSFPARYLKMTGSERMGEKALFAVLAFIFSYVFVSFLSQWNEGLEFPASIRAMEDAALKTTGLLLSGKTVGSLILNLVVLAGFAALSEELFFRGALQQFIQEKCTNGHIAVWITAAVFSLVHFQFYGFVPRLLLGGLLGYLFLYTRSLWIPILFHFINNAFIVVVHYLWGGSERMRLIEETPVSGWLALASALCTVFLFWIYRKKR